MVKDPGMRIASCLRPLVKELNLDPSGTTLEEITNILKNHPNKEDIIGQVRSQEEGIPYEYQFACICWWLGKCIHIQFIDPQPEIPNLSKIDNIKYPDIFAVFSLKNSTFPCLIQVKSHYKRTLKMSKNYVSGLKRHPLAQHYPILVAWKHGEFWTLFDMDTFRTSSGGVKVEFGDAMKANLMSILVGDISFQGLKQGVEWHYVIEPQNIQIIDDLRTGKTKEFIGTLVDISVRDPQSNNCMKVSGPLFYLLSFLGEWRPFTRYTESQITTGESNQSQISLFAYQALIFGAMFQAGISGRMVDWIELLKNRKFTFMLDDIYEFIREGQSKGMGFEESPLLYLPSIKNPCTEGLLPGNAI